jgi:AcrR family transcriptional regulator
MEYKGVSNTKVKISKVALKLFLINGIKGTSTRKIAKGVGITEGAIYKHFSSKNQIAYELFKFYMGKFRKLLIEKSEHGKNPQERIDLLITAFFDFAKTHTSGYNFIMIGHYTELKKLPTDFVKPKDIFVKYISQGMSSHYFRRTDLNLAASMVIGLLTRVILFHENKMIKLDDGNILEEVKSSVIKILR